MRKNLLPRITVFRLLATLFCFLFLSEIIARSWYFMEHRQEAERGISFYRYHAGVLANYFDANFKSDFTRFERDGFCDRVHKNILGKKATAAVVGRSIQPLLKASGGSKVWFYGGSTSDERECGSPPGWPSMVRELTPGFGEIKNASRDQATSDLLVRELKHDLKEGAASDRPAIVALIFTFNDDAHEYSEADPNYSIVSKKIQNWRVDRYRRLLRLPKVISARIDATLYRYVASYQLLKNWIVEQWHSRDEDIFSPPGDRWGVMEIEPYMTYDVENYIANLREIEALSKEYGFKFVFIRPPFVEAYFGRTVFLKWVTEFNSRLDSFLKSEGITVVDVHAALKSANLIR